MLSKVQNKKGRTTEKRKKSILAQLREIMPTSDWFVAGSFAQPYTVFSDIDIYFTSEEAYNTTKEFFSTHTAEKTSSCAGFFEEYATFASSAYMVDNIMWSPKKVNETFALQLVRRQFGNPEQLIADVDLNVCKQYLLPDGTHYADPMAILNPFGLANKGKNFKGTTPRRFLKYLNKYNVSTGTFEKLVKKFITQTISNTACVEDYYHPDKPLQPMNYVMFKTFTRELGRNKELKKFLLDQTLEHAPELLI